MVRCLLLVGLVLASCKQNAKPVEVAAPPTSIDFDAVVKQVHFAWRQEGDVWASRDARWSAEWSPRGVALTPFEGSALKFGLARVNGADQITDVANDQRGGLRVTRANCVEEFSSGDEGVEQRWRFASKPDGAVTVTIPIDGEFVASTKKGLHFKAGDTFVRFGHATWIDAKKIETAIPARFVDGVISLEVPANVVASSSFPAVLDPILEPEQGVDTPVAEPRQGLFTRPDVAWDGTHFLAVWVDQTAAGMPPAVRGARITPNGTLVDANGFTVPRGPWQPVRPRLSWNGTHYLAVWQETSFPSPTSARLVSWRIGANSTVLDTAPTVIAASVVTSDVTPAVAWNGTHHLVVWSDGDVHGARIDTSGALVDTTPAPLVQLSGQQTEARVASDGARFFITFTNGSEIQGRIVAANLTLSPVTTVATAAGTRSGSDVVWSDSQYFVSWQDTRNGNSDIYAARVLATGVVNGGAIAVASSGQPEFQASIAVHGGVGAVLTWVKDNAGQVEVNSSRLSSTGMVLDSTPQLLSGSSQPKTEPRIASTGTSLLVSWTEGQFSKQVYAATVVAGMVGVPFIVPMGENLQGPPAVSAGASDFLVAWSDTRGPNRHFAARVSSTGTVLDPAGIALPIGSGHTRAAWNGTHWLVTSSTGVAARVSAAGQSLDATPIQLAGQNVGTPVSVASNGTDFFAVWNHFGGTSRGARVSNAGVVLDATPIDLALVGVSPAVTWNGDNYVVVGESNGIKAVRVTAAGVRLDTTAKTISAQAGSQTFSLNLAAGPESTLVVYRESGGALSARRIDANAEVIDTTPIVVSSNLTVTNALAWSGRSWVVSWRAVQSIGVEQVLAARIDSAGTRLDVTPLVIDPSRLSHNPGVGCIASRCLIGWNGWDDLGPHQTSRVFTRFLVDDAPASIDQSLTTNEDTALPVTLTGASLTIDTQPQHGALSGTSPNFTYTPTADFHGADSFEFSMNNGVVSQTRAVNITVTPVNDAPVVTGQVLETAFNTPLTTTLTGSDVENDQLTFSVSTPPQHGTVMISGASATYAPDIGFSGADSFQFIANDGTANSAPATIQVTVRAGVHDAGVDDAGVDAGIHDAGIDDAGVDAGVEDAGVHDAGVSDAGIDAGIHDAGTSPDGGTDVNPPGGCGCASVDGSAAFALLGLIALISRRRQYLPRT